MSLGANHRQGSNLHACSFVLVSLLPLCRRPFSRDGRVLVLLCACRFAASSSAAALLHLLAMLHVRSRGRCDCSWPNTCLWGPLHAGGGGLPIMRHVPA